MEYNDVLGILSKVKAGVIKPPRGEADMQEDGSSLVLN